MSNCVAWRTDKVVDAGGGLGVDYDGSRSRRESSINYSLDEYAQNIVRSFAELCAEKQMPQPDIFTESGAHSPLIMQY